MFQDQTKTWSEKVKKINRKPEKRLIKGHEFELRLITDNKNKAGHEARRHRKHGFHTRVIETPPGVFSVYRRLKSVSDQTVSKNANKH
jgi:hypothetical protein